MMCTITCTTHHFLETVLRISGKANSYQFVSGISYQGLLFCFRLVYKSSVVGFLPIETPTVVCTCCSSFLLSALESLDLKTTKYRTSPTIAPTTSRATTMITISTPTPIPTQATVASHGHSAIICHSPESSLVVPPVGAAGVEPVIEETTDAPDAAMLLLFKSVTNWLLAM